VLFLDVNHFKRINDSLGHDIGDHLLQSVAKRLIACTRSSDTVSRQGGYEFVILLSEESRSIAPCAKRSKRSNLCCTTSPGSQVVAEGIQTRKQLAFLQTQRCSFGQGLLQ
jgi:diguanylate cyclase (GGDEF)-like protein